MTIPVCSAVIDWPSPREGLVDVSHSRLVRVDYRSPGAHLDREVADREPSVHLHRVDGRARVLGDALRASSLAHQSQDVKDEVLGIDAALELPVDVEPDGLGDRERVELARSEQVLALRRPYPEGERSRGRPGCRCGSPSPPLSPREGRTPPPRRSCARSRPPPCTSLSLLSWRSPPSA